MDKYEKQRKNYCVGLAKKSLLMVMTGCLAFSSLAVAFQSSQEIVFATENIQNEYFIEDQTVDEDDGKLFPDQFVSKEFFDKANLYCEYQVKIKLNFGKNKDKPISWYVAGATDEQATLFIEKALLGKNDYGIAFNQSVNEINWMSLSDDIKNSIQYTTTPGNDYKIYPNHYGASSIRQRLKTFLTGETSLFTSEEQKFMKDSTIRINDFNTQAYEITDKLFLPSAVLPSSDSEDVTNQYVSVGDNKYKVDARFILSKKKDNNNIPIWTLSPSDKDETTALMVRQGKINRFEVNNGYAINPVFNLDIKNVLFASAAKGGGGKFEKINKADPLNIRYKDPEGSAFFEKNR